MVDLLSLVPDAARTALAQWLAARGEPAYRARQVLPRLWERPVGSWDEATELPAALRRALTEALPLRRLALSARQVSQDGTEKYLWDLGDGEAVESGLIPEGKRRTLCISSQVGCALGCVFCATGRVGFRREPSVGGIAGQGREGMLLDAAPEPANRVFMGMGEPLLIGGKNDALEQADQLAQLAQPLGALVNLLPLHPGGAPDLSPSPRAQMLAFERRLRRQGVEAVLRRSRGLDISAACGQLRVELEARRKVRPEEHARIE